VDANSAASESTHDSVADAVGVHDDAEADRTLSAGKTSKHAADSDEAETSDSAISSESSDALDDAADDDADEDELSADGHGSRELVAAPRDIDDWRLKSTIWRDDQATNPLHTGATGPPHAQSRATRTRTADLLAAPHPIPAAAIPAPPGRNPDLADPDPAADVVRRALGEAGQARVVLDPAQIAAALIRAAPDRAPIAGDPIHVVLDQAPADRSVTRAAPDRASTVRDPIHAALDQAPQAPIAGALILAAPDRRATVRAVILAAAIPARRGLRPDPDGPLLAVDVQSPARGAKQAPTALALIAPHLLAPARPPIPVLQRLRRNSGS
jgi:hypothetical protein